MLSQGKLDLNEKQSQGIHLTYGHMLVIDVEMFLIWRSVVTDCLADVLHGALGHVRVTANVQGLLKRPAVIMCPEDISIVSSHSLTDRSKGVLLAKYIIVTDKQSK